MIKGAGAFELGIADAMFEPADFLEESLRWAARVLRGEVTVDPHRRHRRRLGQDRRRRPALLRRPASCTAPSPAPYRALDLIALARTATRDEGFAAEDEALADLLMGDELRAGLYAFDLVQRRAKRPAGAPDKALARKVTKVGVVGAGLMASQLALLFARRLEVPVVLTDLDQARLDKGVGYVHAEIDKLLGKGRISADQANRLKALVTGSLTKDAFADADFVIEAVFEDLAVKQQVFAEVEEVVSRRAACWPPTPPRCRSPRWPPGCGTPSGSSGFHFFNPVAVMPLLEIVRGAETDDATLATAFAVGRSLKKSSRAGQGRARRSWSTGC